MDYMAKDENHGQFRRASRAVQVLVFPYGISPLRSGMIASRRHQEDDGRGGFAGALGQ